MVEPQIIRCPICKHRIAYYDGRHSTNITAPCRRCNRDVTFDVETGKTTNKARAERVTSSGVRF